MTILTTDEAESLARQARERADEIDAIAAKLPDDGSPLGGPLREAAIAIEYAAAELRALAEHVVDTARSDDERAEHESKLEDDLADAEMKASDLAENIGARLDLDHGWDAARIVEACRERGFYLTGEDAVDCIVRLLEDRPHFPVPAHMRGDLPTSSPSVQIVKGDPRYKYPGPQTVGHDASKPAKLRRART